MSQRPKDGGHRSMVKSETSRGGAAKQKVVLIGAFPPPFGGVSVHIQRLSEHLQDRQFDCHIIDVRRKSRYPANVSFVKSWESLKRILCSKRTVIHIHMSDINTMKSIALLLLSVLYGMEGNWLIVTFHRPFANPQGLRRHRRVLSLVREIIAVSPGIGNSLVQSGISGARISTIPAFVKPKVSVKDQEKVGRRTLDFAEEHYPLISSYGYGSAVKDGIDVYGIDMCLKLCSELAQHYQEMGMIIVLQNVIDKGYLQRIERTISEEGLSERILLVCEEDADFYPIIMRSTVYVRPTVRDGDALAVREALFFGVPTVVSDAVARPESTVLFRNRDMKSFAESVKTVIENYELHKKRLNSVRDKDYAEDVLKVYKTMIEHV